LASAFKLSKYDSSEQQMRMDDLEKDGGRASTGSSPEIFVRKEVRQMSEVANTRRAF
jgi:hypothetical protein